MAMTGGTSKEKGQGEEAPDVTTLSYAGAGAELDAIIDEFEAGVIDVDRLVGQLERATDIVDELDRRLRRTRMRVEELVPRLEAIGKDSTPAPSQSGADDRRAGDGEEGPDERSTGLF